MSWSDDFNRIDWANAPYAQSSMQAANPLGGSLASPAVASSGSSLNSALGSMLNSLKGAKFGGWSGNKGMAFGPTSGSPGGMGGLASKAGELARLFGTMIQKSGNEVQPNPTTETPQMDAFETYRKMIAI
jgi:hypothetical protein